MANRAKKEISIFLDACEHTQYGFQGGPVRGGDGYEDPYEWEIRIAGPPDTPYAEHAFWVRVSLPQQFPFEPPALQFRAPFWHCNVDPTNWRVQVLALREWSTALTVVDYLESLFELMKIPCRPGIRPVNEDAASVYRRSTEEHSDQVLAHVIQHGESDSDDDE